jgi:glycosyltransferase involved in cell wall biosynthesis
MMQETDPGTPPLRVLHVLAPAETGGLESVVRGLAGGLAERGHRIVVGAVISPGARHRFVEESRAAGIDVRALEIPTRAYGLERRTVGRLIGELGAEVLHTHGYRPDVVDLGVARRAGIAAVTTVHGFIGGDWQGRIYERMQVRAFKRFDAVVAVSQVLRDQLLQRGIRSDRLHLVANAWSGDPPIPRDEARRRLGLPSDAVVIGWIGRLSPEKGPDLAVRAMASLPSSVSLSFVGEGRERESTSRLAGELGVSDRIRWHGSVPAAGSLLRAFDAVLLSSRTEGTPIVLLEAMAAGVPVVAMAVGGVPAALIPGAGTLVEPGSVAGLSAALASVVDGARAPAASAHIGAGFSEARAKWLDQYESIYRSFRR